MKKNVNVVILSENPQGLSNKITGSVLKGLTQSMGKTVFFLGKKKRFFKMTVLRAQTELEVHILTPYNPSTLFWTVLLILADLTCVSRNLVSKCSRR